MILVLLSSSSESMMEELSSFERRRASFSFRGVVDIVRWKEECEILENIIQETEKNYSSIPEEKSEIFFIIQQQQEQTHPSLIPKYIPQDEYINILMSLHVSYKNTHTRTKK